MLDLEKIDEIASEVATANLTPRIVRSVSSARIADSEGQDALRITIVIEADAVDRIQGGAALDTLVQLNQRLRRAGDERFAIVEYATEEELENIDDS